MSEHAVIQVLIIDSEKYRRTVEPRSRSSTDFTPKSGWVLEGSTGSSQTGGSRKLLSVRVVSLDALLDSYHHPTVLKIDVEGLELQVLEGGQRMLKTVRPVMLCEVAGNNQEPVSQLLDSCGYELFDLDLAPADRVSLAMATWNTLAIPSHVARRIP